MKFIPSNDTIVLNLLRGAVPERADELCKNWKAHKHIVEVASSSKGSTMDATSKRIKFDTKTIDFFWLFGFSSWLSLGVYSPALEFATSTDITLEEALNLDDAIGAHEFNFKQHVQLALSLLNVTNTADIEWPIDIPFPTDNRESLTDEQDKAVYDLVALGLSFTLLHEFKHVQGRAEEASSGIYQDKAEEEMACDTWARQFMTKGIGNYVETTEETFDSVAQKRAMGIALAAFTIHALTPDSAKWGGGEYPPIVERIEAMIGGSTLPATSHFWCFTACLLISVMRREGRTLDYKGSSSKDFVVTLLSKLH